MNKIFDRKPETERLIAFLTNETDVRLIKYAEIIAAAASAKCKTVNDVRAFLSSARRVLKDKEIAEFGTVRGEGIQRMVPDEITCSSEKRGKRASKQFKEGLKSNRIVEGSNSLSPEARSRLAVTNVVYAKIIYDLAGVKKMIKVATQNGAQAAADIFAAMNK